MTIKEYLDLCIDKITMEEYLQFEKKRKDSSGAISGDTWINLLSKQNLKCYYCKTDLEIIQELVFNNIINPRKRGTHSYSGMHFELDHKNAKKKDNNPSNLVASCYYCNNDKSDTISCDIFENYFGNDKGKSFTDLFNHNNLVKVRKFRHHYKGQGK